MPPNRKKLTIEIAVAILLLITLSTLALLFRGSKNHPVQTVKRREGGSNCPLCGEGLRAGVRVHSTRFPGKEFDLMHIHGCPYCWAGHSAPAPEGGMRDRLCPYCKERLPEVGYVLAQVYRKPGGRTHVHVVGCTVCKPGRG